MASPPPTRIISWRQTVQEADPDYTDGLYRPKVYWFSNGRVFHRPADPYNPVALTPFVWDQFRWDSGSTWG